VSADLASSLLLIFLRKTVSFLCVFVIGCSFVHIFEAFDIACGFFLVFVVHFSNCLGGWSVLLVLTGLQELKINYFKSLELLLFLLEINLVFGSLFCHFLLQLLLLLDLLHYLLAHALQILL